MAELRFRDDAPVDEPGTTLDGFLEQADATAVRIEPGEDVRRLRAALDRLRLVEIGYSAARILRDELGYTGELRAAGDVLVDQLWFMRRCGFDSFAPEKALDHAAVDRALGRYRHVYQAASDGRDAVWRLRHG
jgi:uncharacterized protein (DUF934 family)